MEAMLKRSKCSLRATEKDWSALITEKDVVRSLVDKGTPAALWAGGLGGDPELIRLEARKGIRRRCCRDPE